ncbi:MAG: iron-sulfur cluster assembly accessory protein [Deltaproteobacteria bacterium]|nr:iron-sulfur cluster assembly accessory protein [Deltaproteobacteria bacterium]
MPITLTEAAVERVRELRRMRQSPDDLLRVGVLSGGCNGLNYTVDLVPSAQPGDKVFDAAPDLQVCVDRKSYLFMNGTVVDWVSDLMHAAFEFHNPLAQQTCSCGESFSV